MKRYVLFADNLTAQTHDDFKTAVSDQSGVVWFGLPNGTDLWQPVDAGYVQVLKQLMAHEHHNWLDDEDNANRWFGNDSDPFSAKVFMTSLAHVRGSPRTRHCQSNQIQTKQSLNSHDCSDDD